MNDHEAKATTMKLTLAWLGVTFSWTFTWAEFAAMLAAIYTILLIFEWIWKKVVRPFCEMHGWVKRKYRRASDE